MDLKVLVLLTSLGAAPALREKQALGLEAWAGAALTLGGCDRG